MNAHSARRAAALLATISMGIVGCDTATSPQIAELDPGSPLFDHAPEHSVFMSGSHVMTWDAIPEPDQRSDWGTAYCVTTENPNRAPKFGRDAGWVNPHNAFVVDHPWKNDYFVAPWINAWNHREAWGGNPIAPNHNWTRYSTPVTGNGSFVIRLLADNCSWIYLDGILVGTQGTDLSKNSYGLTLNGTHTLEFIIFDGGGAAGGKFKLETTTTPPPALNPDLDGDGEPNETDAFPLDPTEQKDSDGDGVGDNADAFPHDPTEHTDSDGDGVGDNSDAYPLDPTRWSFDADGDGLSDEVDNCPAVSNSDQADADGDGVGDACDPDRDGDGAANGDDAFPDDPAEWADTDGDGFGDNADAFDHSNTGPVLVVGACNTGVANWHIGNGTWANDLIAAAHASAANHGAFVSAVAALSNEWKSAKLVTGREHGAIVSCAAKTK